jgi:hypothetical protein
MPVHMPATTPFSKLHTLILLPRQGLPLSKSITVDITDAAFTTLLRRQTMTLNIVLKIARLVHLILSTLGISVQISEDPKHTWFRGFLGILTFIAAVAQMIGPARSAANVEQGSVRNQRTFFRADMRCHIPCKCLCRPQSVCR